MKAIPLLACLVLATVAVPTQAQNLFRIGRPSYARNGASYSPDAATPAAVNQYATQVRRTSYESPAQWREAERVQQAWQAYQRAWQRYSARYGGTAQLPAVPPPNVAPSNVAPSNVAPSNVAPSNVTPSNVVTSWPVTTLQPPTSPAHTCRGNCSASAGTLQPADLPPRLTPVPRSGTISSPPPTTPTTTYSPWTTYRSTPPPLPQWFTGT